MKQLLSRHPHIAKFLSKRGLCFLYFTLLLTSSLFAQNNLALVGTATSNNEVESNKASFVIDGNSETIWVSDSHANEKWLSIELPGNTEVSKIKVQLDIKDRPHPISFKFQTYMNGRWKEFATKNFDEDEVISVSLEKPLLTDQVRFSIESNSEIAVKEFEIYGFKYVADLSDLKEILVNQSGYNLNTPKRFTAPKILDDTPFSIKSNTNKETLYEGKINNHIGDFTSFNPSTNDEFIISAGEYESYPFRIGPFWLERITYQNMMDFMTGARHYLGTTKNISRFSWEWRDGDFFNWALQSLIAQYLSNPEAYKRLENKITYVDNASYPSEYKGLWGALEPYDESAPDIVKLIHWDVDVKISQQLEHEHQKAELAHFLYAYPYLKKWLPQQNFDRVYEYLIEKWEKEEVRENSTTKYDRSESHNLLALKTKMGTNKGELPPGHSVIPNLMMYEVVKKESPKDANTYFDAAYNQMEWMIENLDWNDPMTTKGQRMSEHITMRAFAYFYNQYPEKAPINLQKKVVEWANVAAKRSQNMWDFRKYTDEAEWAPIGWNETGNVLGFPAAALAAKSVIDDTKTKKKLNQLTWSHFDNAFGRNPVGRHYSFDGPREIEGVELGWYNAHHGGIGLLEPVPFVFDGSPKAEHYPNHPELGNIGWTEGWVQFNIAFNISMAYLANDETEIEISSSNKKNIQVRLKAPLNFYEDKIDTVTVDVFNSKGEKIEVKLVEENPYSEYLSANLSRKGRKISNASQTLRVHKDDTLTTSYGLGYFKKTASMPLE